MEIMLCCKREYIWAKEAFAGLGRAMFTKTHSPSPLPLQREGGERRKVKFLII